MICAVALAHSRRTLHGCSNTLAAPQLLAVMQAARSALPYLASLDTDLAVSAENCHSQLLPPAGCEDCGPNTGVLYLRHGWPSVSPPGLSWVTRPSAGGALQGTVCACPKRGAR